MIVDLPSQVILWNNADGTRQSEHRSVGDCLYFYDGARYPRDNIHVIVRGPRDKDPVHVICCTSHLCKPPAFETRRPVALAEFEDEEEADEFAQQHAESHLLVTLPFWRRRSHAYHRQARLERDLA